MKPFNCIYYSNCKTTYLKAPKSLSLTFSSSSRDVQNLISLSKVSIAPKMLQLKLIDLASGDIAWNAKEFLHLLHFRSDI